VLFRSAARFEAQRSSATRTSAPSGPQYRKAGGTVSLLSAGHNVVTGPFRILRELKEGARVELLKKDRGKGRGGRDQGAR